MSYDDRLIVSEEVKHTQTDIKEGFEEKIKCMERDEKAFYLCESTIEIIKNVSGKPDTVDGINWLINVADENGKLNTKLEAMCRLIEERDAHITKQLFSIDALKEANDELKAEMNEYHRAKDGPKEELEEHKASIRSITTMGKEEPYEQVEKLLSDVRGLTTENRKLEDSNANLTKKLTEALRDAQMEKNGAFDYRMHWIKEEGATEALKEVIEIMCKNVGVK